MTHAPRPAGLRSIRVDPEVLRAASARAKAEGTTLNAVMSAFAALYADGTIHAPTRSTTIHPDPRDTALMKESQ